MAGALPLGEKSKGCKLLIIKKAQRLQITTLVSYRLTERDRNNSRAHMTPSQSVLNEIICIRT
jgi:hypothetical protein